MKKIIFISLLLTANTGFCLIGGTEAKPGQGDGVFNIVIADETEEDNYFNCTATKISPNTFITAAHCFERKVPASIGFSTQVRNKEFEYDGLEIENVITHESYNGDKEDSEEDFGANSIDLALVKVKTNSEFDKIKIRELDFSDVAPNAKVEMWGFGCQKSNNKIDDYFPVKKFASNTTLDKSKLAGKFGIFTAQVNETKDQIYKNTIPTSGINLSKTAASLCSGDSGGPLFSNNKLVGVNFSYLAEIQEDGTSKTGLTTVNLHVRLSVVKSWVEETLK